MLLSGEGLVRLFACNHLAHDIDIDACDLGRRSSLFVCFPLFTGKVLRRSHGIEGAELLRINSPAALLPCLVNGGQRGAVEEMGLGTGREEIPQRVSEAERGRKLHEKRAEMKRRFHVSQRGQCIGLTFSAKT